MPVIDPRRWIHAVLAVQVWAALPLHVGAQAPTRIVVPAEGEEMIITVRANDVRRGDFTVVRRNDGDFWFRRDDLATLGVQPLPAARRDFSGETYYSLQAQGATGLKFDEVDLVLAFDLPAGQYQGATIDLSNRPAPLTPTPPQPSAILNYRAGVRHTGTAAPLQLLLATELNLRMGEVLFRQEAKVETGRPQPAFARGATQLVWDNRLEGRRVVAGDQLTLGGPFGTSITAAGVSVSRIFDITPDLLRQPTASMNVTATTPSQVEVSVDGSPVYRGTVAPGPVNLQNLFYLSGARTVRVVVTDASGRRQVFEQPFLFTDSALARGVQEYSYFAGRRSTLGADDRWHYGERVAQGYHRIGATDHVTLEGSAEGTSEFTSGGGGLTLRSDRLGLVSLALLASNDRAVRRSASGWSARYTYLSPWGSFAVGRREQDPAFRTLATTPFSARVLSETRVGVSTRLFDVGNISMDWGRVEDTLATRDNLAVRMSTYLGRRTLLSGEYMRSSGSGGRDWAFNLYLRHELELQQWVGSTVRMTNGFRAVDLEAGRTVDQGEGLGYRVGTSASAVNGEGQGFAYGTANWNLRNVTLDGTFSKQLRGGSASFAEAGVSGALVGLSGYVGTTRQVTDSFAVARLGVPHPGVEVFLNSQLQGKTNEEGVLLIPNVGAFGRQDISLNDKQIPMQYDIASRRVTIAPAYRSGTVVDFGGRQLRAATGTAWLVQGAGRKPAASRRWNMQAAAGSSLLIETAPGGEFYLEDAPKGSYRGALEVDGTRYSCRMEIPDFSEAVHELGGGLLCE
jgi:outer membrane usher protein